MKEQRRPHAKRFPTKVTPTRDKQLEGSDSCKYCGLAAHRDEEGKEAECPGTFLYNLAKGRLAETIVRQLLSAGGYIVVPSGFESLFPELSSNLYHHKRSQLTSEPDFVAYRPSGGDKSITGPERRPRLEVYLVEVKFRGYHDPQGPKPEYLAEMLSGYLWWPPFRLVLCYGNGEIAGIEVTAKFFRNVYQDSSLVEDPFSTRNQSRIKELISRTVGEMNQRSERLWQPVEELFCLDLNDPAVRSVREVARKLLVDGISYAERDSEAG